MPEYTLKLAQQEVAVLMQALGELPLKIAAGTFSKINQQINEQDAAGAVSLESLGLKEDNHA